MPGHAWFAPEERQIILNALVAGSDWATASHLVIGTDEWQVDNTFADTQQTILEAEAAKFLAASLPGAISREDTYAHLVTPTFTSITPATGDAGGGERVVIVGTGFHNPAVTIGGHAQTVVSWNPTTIVIRTVAHAAEAACHVIVTNHSTNAVEATDAFEFTAAATPAFTSITPSSGPAWGGTVCRIVGTGFKEGVTVQFGTTYALIQSWTATLIVCVAPRHAVGAVNLIIMNPSGNHDDEVTPYTYT